MRQQPALQGLSVEDVLSNPFGGPHWLPAEYGFTPLPELHRATSDDFPPSPPTHPPEYPDPPSYPKSFTAEELGLSQEERDFLQENGHLHTGRDRFDQGTETIPHGEHFRKYVERKMQRFGRQPRQNTSALNTLTDTASTLNVLTDAALQEAQNVIDRSKPDHTNGSASYRLTDTELQGNDSTQEKSQNSIGPEESIYSPVKQEKEPKFSDEQDERDERSRLSPLGSASPWRHDLNRLTNNSQMINQEWSSADFEQDVKTFISASRPDREFPQDVEASLRSSYRKPSPDADNSTALGKLFHSLIDIDAGLESDERYRIRSRFQTWSDVAQRSTKPIYIAPHLR